jgi:tetratricopeptide (TPR) repeat protein
MAREWSEAEMLALVDRSSVGAPEVLGGLRSTDPERIRRVLESADALDAEGVPLVEPALRVAVMESVPVDATDARDDAGSCAVAVYRQRASGMSGADVVDPSAYRAQHRPPYHRLPDDIRGRTAEIARVRRAIETRGPITVALSGPLGIGKSTVALAAARAADPAGACTWWASAETVGDLDVALLGVVTAAGASVRRLDQLRSHSGEPRVVELFALAADLLGQDVLLLEDLGSEVTDLVKRALRRPRLVITTRNDAEGLARRADRLRVTPLAAVDGARVLLDQLRRPEVSAIDARHAEIVAERLGGTPLALRNIGALLAAGPSGQSILDGLGELSVPAESVGLDEMLYEVSLAMIDRTGSTEARTLLQLLALHGEAPIPEAVLNLGRSGRATLDNLVRVALVERTVVAEVRCVRVHRAVARRAQRDQRIEPAVRVRLQHRALDLLAAELVTIDPGAPADWNRARFLPPLVAELVGSVGASLSLRVAAAQVSVQLAVVLARSGDQIGAARLVEDALRRCRLPDDALARFSLLRTQAWLVGLAGDLPDAEQRLRALLPRQIAVLGTRNRSTLDTRDCLAWTLAEQGDLRRAAFRFSALLRDCSSELGDTDPTTLAVRHRTAWVVALLGRQRQAADELERVLEIRMAKFGFCHLDVFSTRYRLGWVDVRLGRVEEGGQRFRTLLEDVRSALGEDHPITLLVRWRLAWTLHWQGHLDEAERLFRDLLGDQEKDLGVDHPRALQTRLALACIEVHRGRVVEGVQQLRGVLEERLRILGPGHRESLDSRSYLAWALSKAGALGEAIEVHEALLPDRRRILGDHHPETLRTRVLLAEARLAAGRPDRALRDLDSITEIAATVLEPDDRLSFDIRELRAKARGHLGRLAEAEAELREVDMSRTAALGTRHREVLAGRADLVWVIGMQGRITDASALCHALLADSMAVHGIQHPQTFAVRRLLVWLETLNGDLGSNFSTLAADALDGLGAAHPEALRIRSGVAWVRRLRGDLDGAEGAYQALQRDAVRALGPDSLLALRARDGIGLVLLARKDCHTAYEHFSLLQHDCVRVLGPRHRDTLVVREHAARCLVQLGRAGQARTEYADIAALRSDFDSTHPDRKRAPRLGFFTQR